MGGYVKTGTGSQYSFSEGPYRTKETECTCTKHMSDVRNNENEPLVSTFIGDWKVCTKQDQVRGKNKQEQFVGEKINNMHGKIRRLKQFTDDKYKVKLVSPSLYKLRMFCLCTILQCSVYISLIIHTKLQNNYVI